MTTKFLLLVLLVALTCTSNASRLEMKKGVFDIEKKSWHHFPHFGGGIGGGLGFSHVPRAGLGNGGAMFGGGAGLGNGGATFGGGAGLGNGGATFGGGARRFGGGGDAGVGGTDRNKLGAGSGLGAGKTGAGQGAGAGGTP